MTDIKVLKHVARWLILESEFFYVIQPSGVARDLEREPFSYNDWVYNSQ